MEDYAVIKEDGHYLSGQNGFYLTKNVDDALKFWDERTAQFILKLCQKKGFCKEGVIERFYAESF